MDKRTQITIDRDKCKYSLYDPLGCKLCIQNCPRGIFCTLPVERTRKTNPETGKWEEPTVWQLLVAWEDKCDLCGHCVNICPHKAIKVEVV